MSSVRSTEAMTMAEAAECLGLSEAFVARLIEIGRLRVDVDRRGRQLVAMSALAAYRQTCERRLAAVGAINDADHRQRIAYL